MPFLPLENPLDCQPLLDLIGRRIGLWRNSARQGERIGDFIDRIGWPAFLRRAEVDFDPYLIDDFDPFSVRRDLQIRWDSGNGAR